MGLKLIHIIIITLVIITYSCIITKVYGGDMQITKEEVIEIASKEAIRLGYYVESMDTKVTQYDTPWNEYLPKESETEYDIERKKKLTNKKYWAVYYYPKTKKNVVIKGGDLCIFIDSSSGEILTSIRWK